MGNVIDQLLIVLGVVMFCFLDGEYCLLIDGEWVVGEGCIIVVENLVCEQVLVEVCVVLME